MATHQISLTGLYGILYEKRGKEEADAIVNYVEEKINLEFDHHKSEIVLEIEKLRSEIKVEIEKSRTDFEKALRNQLWVIVALFIPLYVTITIALMNLLHR